MVRVARFSVLLACVSLAACKGVKVHSDGSQAAAVEVEASSAAPADAGGAGEDGHWIRGDEVFTVQYEGQETLPCFEVSIAKMVEQPSEATKGQAKLFGVRAAKEIWSSHWWRTRLATRADLKQGTVVVFFKGPMEGTNVHHAPPSRDVARPGGDGWFCGTIADDSEAFKGVVKVSGYDYAIHEGALRVVVK